jgi:acyl-CoA synthetase (AMP-forming)/AMP-acid ligase II
MSGPAAIRRERLGDALDAAAIRYAGQIGWTFDEEHVSFEEMKRRSDQVAASLIAQGIGPGAVVAVLIPNLPEFAACLFACAKIGAVVTAINTRSKLFEIEHVLSHSEARVLIMADRLLNQDFVQLVLDVLGPASVVPGGAVDSARFPSLRQLVSVPGVSHPLLMPWVAFVQQAIRTSPAELLARQAARQIAEPVLLQYTSGTTALPKGALCDHVYVLNFGAQNTMRLGVGAGEAILNTQPFYHVGGSCGAVPTPLVLGCRFVFPRYYDAETVLRLLERERCVARTGFASMYIMEMDHPSFSGFDLSRLRAAWCVGTASLMAQVRDRMGIDRLIQIYGATEACGCSGDVDDPWEKRSATCGRVYPEMEIGIMDTATGALLPPDTTGEIVMRGWCTMIGYLKQPEETAKAIDGAGWVHTGDRGTLDADGYLTFLGRIKNMIRVGGENVSAEEVEAMLMRHPKVRMAQAIPIPDPRLQEVVLGIVELADGADATEAEIIDFCKPLMANFRVPRRIRFVRQWPMTGSGKIQRHELLKQFSGDGPLA